MKGGAEAYAFNLRRYATTNLTADEIHDVGLKQVARIESELDVILRQLGRVYPGQACSCMLGQLKLIELRDKARATLGDRFSFKDYHNAVLAIGTVPLQMLERETNAYIQSRTK